MTAKTATTAEIAAELATTPRELRKFLRSLDQGVGKGARYALPANARELAKMRKNFAEWDASRTAAKSDKAEVTDMEVIDDELADTDIEPTDADLDMIDLED